MLFWPVVSAHFGFVLCESTGLWGCGVRKVVLVCCRMALRNDKKHCPPQSGGPLHNLHKYSCIDSLPVWRKCFFSKTLNYQIYRHYHLLKKDGKIHDEVWDGEIFLKAEEYQEAGGQVERNSNYSK